MRELIKRGVVRNISTLRKNVNGYPFVTLLSKKGDSQNLYFGQKSGVLIQDNFEVGENIIPALKDSTVIKTINADGEARYKLSLPAPGGSYSTDSELMDVFGIDDVEYDFNIAEFQQQFSAKEVSVAQPA